MTGDLDCCGDIDLGLVSHHDVGHAIGNCRVIRSVTLIVVVDLIGQVGILIGIRTTATTEQPPEYASTERCSAGIAAVVDQLLEIRSVLILAAGLDLVDDLVECLLCDRIYGDVNDGTYCCAVARGNRGLGG